MTVLTFMNFWSRYKISYHNRYAMLNDRRSVNCVKSSTDTSITSKRNCYGPATRRSSCPVSGRKRGTAMN